MIKTIRSLSQPIKATIFVAIDLALLMVSLLVSQLAIYGFAGWDHSFDTAAGAASVCLLAAVSVVALIRLGIPFAKLNSYDHQGGFAYTLVYAIFVSLAWRGLDQVMGTPQHTNAYVLFGGVLIVVTGVTRICMLRVVRDMYRRDNERCRVLIYGAGGTGRQLGLALRTHDYIDPVAFLDDNTSLQGARVIGLPVLPPANLAVIKETQSIDRVLIAMPSMAPARIAQIVRRVEEMGLECQVLPSFAQLIGEEELVQKLKPASAQNFLGRSSHARGMLGEAVKSYRNHSVMVTGAGGSIGSELCRQIIGCRARRVILFELSEAALYKTHQEICAMATEHQIEVVPVLGSVADQVRVQEVIETYGVDVILHAAAYKHVPLVEINPLSGIENNVFGTVSLAAAAVNCGVERIILISTDKAVKPRGVMGATKRMSEIVLQDMVSRHPGTELAIVRFGNVLGSSGSVIPLFQEQISRGGPVTVTDPNMTRYFMTISEAVGLVLRAGARESGSGLFVLDMGKPVSILELARQVIEAAGRTVREPGNEHGDIEIEIIGARPGEKLTEELTETGDLVATGHPKILTTQQIFPSEIEVAKSLRDLRRAMELRDADGASIEQQPAVAVDTTAKRVEADPDLVVTTP